MSCTSAVLHANQGHVLPVKPAKRALRRGNDKHRCINCVCIINVFILVRYERPSVRPSVRNSLRLIANISLDDDVIII